MESIETRLQPEDFEDEPGVHGAPIQAQNTMERLIEDVSKQGTKGKVEVSNFKGELDPDLFMDLMYELDRLIFSNGRD